MFSALQSVSVFVQIAGGLEYQKLLIITSTAGRSRMVQFGTGKEPKFILQSALCQDLSFIYQLFQPTLRWPAWPSFNGCRLWEM